MIGSTTISAEEGGLVTMSWDSVNFLDMVHNQQSQTNSQLFSGGSVTSNLPRFGLMQAIEYKQPESDREPLPESIGMIENLNRELLNAGVLLNNIAFRSPLVSHCTMFVPSLAVTADLLEIGVGALQESLHKLFPPNSQQITKD